MVGSVYCSDRGSKVTNPVLPLVAPAAGTEADVYVRARESAAHRVVRRAGHTCLSARRSRNRAAGQVHRVQRRERRRRVRPQDRDPARRQRHVRQSSGDRVQVAGDRRRDGAVHAVTELLRRSRLRLRRREIVRRAHGTIGRHLLRRQQRHVDRENEVRHELALASLSLHAPSRRFETSVRDVHEVVARAGIESHAVVASAVRRRVLRQSVGTAGHDHCRADHRLA